jgi:VanZ family protein
MILIFLLSNEVSGTSSGRSEVIVDVLTNSLRVSLSEDILTFITRKAAHIIAYFILGVLIYSVVRTYKLVTRRAILICIAIALVYAISDEVHQLFVPGRSGEIRDVLIDTSASALGVYIYYFIYKRCISRINSNNKV